MNFLPTFCVFTHKRLLALADILPTPFTPPLPLALAVPCTTSKSAPRPSRVRSRRRRSAGVHSGLTSTLAAAVAHELNNTLLAAAMLAESSAADTSLDSRLAPLINQSQSLSATLLALAVSPDPSSLAQTDLSTWLRHHTSQFARTSPPSIRVACELPTAAILARTNPIALDLVLRTLASNAIEAMDSQGDLLVQLVAPTPPTDPIELRVSDTGPGVPSHLRHRIFDLGFSTRDPSRQRGLGLALARNLLKHLGGSLTYQPNVPRGASFVIRLPRHFSSP